MRSSTLLMEWHVISTFLHYTYTHTPTCITATHVGDAHTHTHTLFHCADLVTMSPTTQTGCPFWTLKVGCEYFCQAVVKMDWLLVDLFSPLLWFPPVLVSFSLSLCFTSLSLSDTQCDLSLFVASGKVTTAWLLEERLQGSVLLNSLILEWVSITHAEWIYDSEIMLANSTEGWTTAVSKLYIIFIYPSILVHLCLYFVCVGGVTSMWMIMQLTSFSVFVFIYLTGQNVCNFSVGISSYMWFMVS